MTNVLIHLQGGSRAVDIHDDSDLWRIEGPSTVLARSGSRGQGDQVPAPILPKSRRESGLPVLESRQSFSRAQVRLHYTHTSHHLLLLNAYRPALCQRLSLLSIVVLCVIRFMDKNLVIFSCCCSFPRLYRFCTLHDVPFFFCLFVCFSTFACAQPNDSTPEHVSSSRKLSQSHEPTVFKVSWIC